MTPISLTEMKKKEKCLILIKRKSPRYCQIKRNLLLPLNVLNILTAFKAIRIFKDEKFHRINNLAISQQKKEEEKDVK